MYIYINICIYIYIWTNVLILLYQLCYYIAHACIRHSGNFCKCISHDQEQLHHNDMCVGIVYTGCLCSTIQKQAARKGCTYIQTSQPVNLPAMTCLEVNGYFSAQAAESSSMVRGRCICNVSTYVYIYIYTYYPFIYAGEEKYRERGIDG